MEYTNTGLVEYAKAQLGKPYWYGTYGNIASAQLYAEKKRQYPKYYTATDFGTQYGQKVHDCAGLIKGYLMTPDADKYPNNPAQYNPKWDWSANMTIENATEKGAIGTLPELAGLIVWKNNHVGIYIGNGEVIEAKGHKYGVIKSKLKDTNWQMWCKHPAINYAKPVPAPDRMCDVPMYELRRGDKMNQVSLLQLLLFEKGFKGKDGKDLEIDKSFGGNTEYAVNSFKASHGLPKDGIVDLDTWKILTGISYA